MNFQKKKNLVNNFQSLFLIQWLATTIRTDFYGCLIWKHLLYPMQPVNLNNLQHAAFNWLLGLVGYGALYLTYIFGSFICCRDVVPLIFRFLIKKEFHLKWLKWLSRLFSFEFFFLKAKPHLNDENIEALVDPRLCGDYDVQQLKTLVFTASLCIRASAMWRPTMVQVLPVSSIADGFPKHFNVILVAFCKRS